MSYDPMDGRVRQSKILSWQRRRGYANACRLAQDVSRLALANGAACLGRDGHAASMFEKGGLGADAVATVRLRAFGKTSTVAVPTFRTWGLPNLRRLAEHVAHATIRAGRDIIVVSPDDVTRQPRLANAYTICGTQCAPSADDLRRIEAFVEAAGGEASLAACSTALGTRLGMERIFGLAVGGWLMIDLTPPLGAETRVRLRSTSWAFRRDVLGRHDERDLNAAVGTHLVSRPTCQASGGDDRPSHGGEFR